MKKAFNLGQTEFDALLDLLSEDREEAAARYERLRLGLARFFRYKGCQDPFDLVDETFDRVAKRTHKFDSAVCADPEKYFYGFATNIAMEHKRRAHRWYPLDGVETRGPDHADNAWDESKTRCLRRCLGELDGDDKSLITSYHEFEGQARIDMRRRLCEELSLTPTALYARVSRLRGRLRGCVENCLGENR